jgi:hypothetical protein
MADTHFVTTSVTTLAEEVDCELNDWRCVMTFGKAVALIAGFAVAFALGVLMSPFIRDEGRVTPVAPSVSRVESPVAVSTTSPPPVSAARVTARATTPAIAPSATELHGQLKPLLNKGADMTIASQGFRTAEQFAAVAHAARNTQVPFMVLKHRVLDEGKTLEAAIRESKPEMNAKGEANRAIAEAKADLAKLAG